MEAPPCVFQDLWRLSGLMDMLLTYSTRGCLPKSCGGLLSQSCFGHRGGPAQ